MTVAAETESDMRAYDVEAVRRDFPILAKEVHGKPLVFLDSAASAQKPAQVLDAVRDLYEGEYANVHRGAYWLSERATDRYEAAREKVRAFIGAASAREIIFTRNATEAINLVAATHGRKFLNAGDEVVISDMEHHSNIVPWQMLRDETGIVLKVAPITDDGAFQIDAFTRLLGPRTKLVAITHMSNVLGTVVPVADVVRASHAVGAADHVAGNRLEPGPGADQVGSQLPAAISAAGVHQYPALAEITHGGRADAEVPLHQYLAIASAVALHVLFPQLPGVLPHR